EVDGGAYRMLIVGAEQKDVGDARAPHERRGNDDVQRLFERVLAVGDARDVRSAAAQQERARAEDEAEIELRFPGHGARQLAHVSLEIDALVAMLALQVG